MAALPFHPSPGDILICDYGTGFRAPEMIKRRLCVVVSPKLKRRNDLASVVPLSETAPDPEEDWHHKIELISNSWGNGPRWAKCDMIATVAYDRLARPHYRHSVTNARLYERLALSVEDLTQVKVKIALALGLAIEL
jgi:mRNA interferase MazF